MNRHRLLIASSLLLATPALATRNPLFDDDALTRFATFLMVLPAALAAVIVGAVVARRPEKRVLAGVAVAVAVAAFSSGAMAVWSTKMSPATLTTAASALLVTAVILLVVADLRAFGGWIVASVVAILMWIWLWFGL